MTHEGRRPGDRRVRVERTRPEQFTVKAPRPLRKAPSPAVALVGLFAVLISAGTVLLMLLLAPMKNDH